MSRRNAPSAPYPALRRAPAAEDGAISLLFLMLVPLIILVGGLATDLSLINAQKKYAQSQADLATMSAATALPDLAEARRRAQQTVDANPAYGAITLATGDVVFGQMRDGAFVAAADQTSPAGVSAVAVHVAAPYAPLLLRPFGIGEGGRITRSATASQRAAIAFGLRNTLLNVDTADSILDGLLQGVLGLDSSVDLLNYAGIAGLGVGINDLLGFVSLGVTGEVLDYSDILDLGVGLPVVVDALRAFGVLPEDSTTSSLASLDLGSLLSISPTAVGATVGQILPNLSLNAFDLLAAIVSLNGSLAGKLVSLPLALNLGPIANIGLTVGLSAPPVTAVGFVDDSPAPMAEVSQVSLDLDAKLLSLIRLTLGIAGANASATVTSLNCAATAPGDLLATFDTENSAIGVKLELTIEGLIEGHENTSGEVISLFGGEGETAVTLGDLGRPVDIETPVLLSGLTDAVSGLLDNLSDSLETERHSCGLLGLSCLLSTINDLIKGISALLEKTVLNSLVDALFGALGIELAPAELIVSDYSCSARLVQ